MPADGGITAFELLRRAAAEASLELDEPNNGLGDPVRRTRVLAAAGLTEEESIEDVFAEPLRGDADSSALHFLELGYAGALATAPPDPRDHVLNQYRQAFDEAAACGQGEHRVLFVVCRSSAL